VPSDSGLVVPWLGKGIQCGKDIVEDSERVEVGLVSREVSLDIKRHPNSTSPQPYGGTILPQRLVSLGHSRGLFSVVEALCSARPHLRQRF
jgi:hypothetical protein